MPKLPPRAAAAEEATQAAAPLAAAKARAKVPRDLADLMPLPRPLQAPGRLAVESVMKSMLSRLDLVMIAVGSTKHPTRYRIQGKLSQPWTLTPRTRKPSSAHGVAICIPK